MDLMEMMSPSRMTKGKAAGEGREKWMRRRTSSRVWRATNLVMPVRLSQHAHILCMTSSRGWDGPVAHRRAGRIAFQLTKRTTHPSTHVRTLQTTPALERQRYLGWRTGRGQVAFAFFKLGTPLLPSLGSSYRADQNGSSILYCTGTKSQPDIVYWPKCE